MLENKLFTRDGVEVKGIGSWEQEQLRKNPIPKIVETPKDVQKSKSAGLSNIYRSENCKSKTPHWIVRFNSHGKHLIARNFYDKEHGFDEKKSLKAALKYRDEKRKQFTEEGIDFTDRRKNENN